MAVIAVAPIPETAAVELLEPVPDGARLVSCPLCHTTHPSLTRDALEAGGDWRCTRCGQRWDARRLATVAAYAAWVVAQDTRARVRGAAGPANAAPLPATRAGGINEAEGGPLVDTADVTSQEPGVVEDEALAVRCAATTCLITAATAADVEAAARRIHAAGLRAAFPLVHVSADTLPTDATRFSEAYASLIDAGRGGILLVTNVEAMPAVVQESLVETLAQLQGASDPLDAVRLIAGTTVILHDCIVAGTFSERLFYRLNIIHVVMPGCCATRHTLNAGTPTSAESQAAFVRNDHISEVRSE